MLPLNLQMEIDLSAAAHKREIAEGFAKLRGSLLPERKATPQELYRQAMMEAMRPVSLSQLHGAYWNAGQSFSNFGSSNALGGIFGGCGPWL